MSLQAADWNAADARTHQAVPLGARVASWFSSGRRALREAGAIPADSSGNERALSLLAGLAADAGMDAPALWLFDGSPNSLVTRRPRVIAVSRSLLDEFSRTELEGVLAHGLIRTTQSGSHVVGYDDDVAAVALTRFPPALADALVKIEPVTGRFARFYLVADSPWHRKRNERIAALNDL